MKKVGNNKGFTLVELLAVLVILAAIMGIAIPSITASMERSKAKQNASKIKMLESFAELYVTEHKNSVYKNLERDGNQECKISISEENYQKYITEDANIDADGNEITGIIIFNKEKNSYTHQYNDSNAIKSCIQ